MKTAAELLAENVKSISLQILLFGPNPGLASTDAHALDLLNKRKEIRDALLADGHGVKFGEELVDPSLPPPASNPYLQEMLLLAEYDLIINLIYSPGSIAELGMLVWKRDFAEKAHLFICDQFKDGLVYQQCVLLRDSFRARLTLYVYPNDVVDCNLLTLARATTAEAQVAKFLSP